MTRIGFAYNQKPVVEDLPIVGSGDLMVPEDEPPSSRRDDPSRTSDSPATQSGAAAVSPVTALPTADDRFAEWDTPETIDAVARALAPLGEVIRLEADPDFPARLRDARPDIVFNIAEGLHGPNREAHVPAICEFFGFPYSGSDPFTLSLCLDKARTKETLAYHGITTAPFLLVRSFDEIESLPTRLAGHHRHPGLRFPLFAKPVQEGSSKGITERNVCRDRRELETTVAELLVRYEQPVLVETFLPGAEFTCGVLGNGAAARVLPIVAMNFGALPPGALPIYGYEAKWLWDSVDAPLDIYECPARISSSLCEAIERVVLRAYQVLGCRDWSRVDVRLDADGVPNIVEVNPLPGILPDPRDNSCLPKAARAAGMEYDELIQACLLAAAERQGVAIGRPLARRRGVQSDERTPRVAAAG